MEGECALDLQVICAAAMMGFMLVFVVMMWKISSGMKQFLSDNIEEALIVSAECIGDQIQSIEKAMAEKMNVLQNENRALRGDLSRQLNGISAIIADAIDKSEIGVNSIVKELNYIIPTLRDEMKKLLQTLSENAGTFQKITLKNFEDEIKKFIQTINSSYANLDKAAQEQSKMLENVSGTVQGVLKTSAKDIQSDFEKTRATIQEVITEAMKQIDEDYQSNMRSMFQAMADNLAAITQELRASSAGGESGVNTSALETLIQDITKQLEEINSKTVKQAKSDGTKKVLEEVSEKLDKIIDRLAPPASPETTAPAQDEPPATAQPTKTTKKKKKNESASDAKATSANTEEVKS